MSRTSINSMDGTLPDRRPARLRRSAAAPAAYPGFLPQPRYPLSARRPGQPGAGLAGGAAAADGLWRIGAMPARQPRPASAGRRRRRAPGAPQRHARRDGRPPTGRSCCTGCARGRWRCRSRAGCWCMPACCRNGRRSWRWRWRRSSRPCCRAARGRTWLQRMYGNQPDRWSDGLAGDERWRVVVNAMTRLALLRCRRPDGLPPQQGRRRIGASGLSALVRGAGGGAARTRRSPFGDWSTLGLAAARQAARARHRLPWGGCPSAARLQPQPEGPAKVAEIIQVDRPQTRQPGV